MVRFGYERGLPKPRTEEDWSRLFNKHKYNIYNVKAMTVEWGKKGSGQTGTRMFHYFSVPPLKHWNPDLQISERKNAEGPSKLTIVEDSGREFVIETQGKKHEDILKNVLERYGEARPELLASAKDV